MDAVKFLEERKRMFKNGYPVLCLNIDNNYDSKKVVKIVEEWSAAHPVKTRQSVFLSHYPNAEVDGDGVLKVCPKVVEGSGYINSSTCGCMPCAACHKAYWSVEVVEKGAKMGGGVDDASV